MFGATPRSVSCPGGCSSAAATQISTGRQTFLRHSYAPAGGLSPVALLPRGRRSAQKTPQPKQPLVRSLVSNKTLHQTGKGTAAVQTARARYSLIHPQEWLWPFAKNVGRFFVYESLLSELVQLWRPDRQSDSRTCVCSVATTCTDAGTCGRPAGRAAAQSAKL